MQWQVQQLQLNARSDQPRSRKKKKKVTLFPDFLSPALFPFALSIRNNPNLNDEAFSFL